MSHADIQRAYNSVEENCSPFPLNSSEMWIGFVNINEFLCASFIVTFAHKKLVHKVRYFKKNVI
jgi:hypothetical protein